MSNMIEKACLVIYLAEYKSLSSSCKRTLGLLNGLMELGYAVDFLTVDTEGDSGNREELSFLKGINVIPAWTTKFNSTSIIQFKGFKGKVLRTLADIYHLFFIHGHTYQYAKQVKISSLSQTRYNYIISVSDPKTSHIALKSLINQGLSSDKIIEYWGDPLYGDVSLKTIYPNKIIKKIEYNLLSSAQRIVYTSPFTLEQEKSIFPNLSDRMSFVPTANLKESYYNPYTEETIRVGYFGDYYSQYRNIIPLYQSFLSESSAVSNIRLTIVGDSDLTLKSTKRIKVLQRQKIDKLQAETDILVCVLNNHGTQIPGKLYYNAGTNLPVLVILDGEHQNEIKKYLDGFDRFICCDNNVDSISKNIEDIAHRKPTYKPSPFLSPKIIASKIID